MYQRRAQIFKLARNCNIWVRWEHRWEKIWNSESHFWLTLQGWIYTPVTWMEKLSSIWHRLWLCCISIKRRSEKRFSIRNIWAGCPFCFLFLVCHFKYHIIVDSFPHHLHQLAVLGPVVGWLSLLRTDGIGLINSHASTVQHQRNYNQFAICMKSQISVWRYPKS